MGFAGSHGGLVAGRIAQYKTTLLVDPHNTASGEGRSPSIDDDDGTARQTRMLVELGSQRCEPGVRPRFVQRREGC